MSKQVAKKETTEVALPEAVRPESFGSEYNPTYLQLMQGGSDLVKEGEFNSGDWVISDTQEKIGDNKAKPKFVVLGIRQGWVVEHGVKQGDKIKWNWVRNESITVENDSRQWRWQDDDDQDWRAVRTYWLYLLSMERAEANEFSFLEPLVLRMGSTAAKSAQNIKKQLLGVSDTQGCMTYQIVFEFGSKLIKKDDNSWLDVVARPLRKTTVEEDLDIIRWVPLINAVCARPVSREDAVKKEDNSFLDEDDSLASDDIPF